MAEDKIEIEIVLDDGSVKKGFASINKQAKSSSDTMQKTFSRGLGTLAAGAAALGTALAAAFAGRKIIAAAAEQESAVNALNTSLQLAGTFSQEASQSFQDLASSIQSMSTFGDEVILQQAALARNFTDSNEQAEKLTKAAVELSAATGMSLDSSVKNLGKTFAGLAGELGESVPAIRALSAESLKSGAALDLILERFGGAAAAKTKTFAGAMEQLQNLFGDLLEEIGMLVTKSPVLIAVFNAISDLIGDAIKQLSGFGKTGGDVFGDLIKTMLDFGKVFNQFVLMPIEILVNVLTIAFRNAVTTVSGAVAGIITAASNLASFFAPDSGIAKNLAMMKEATQENFLDNLGNSISGLKNVLDTSGTDSINGFIDNLRKAAENADPVLAKIADKFVETKEKVGQSVLEMKNAVGNVFKTGMANIVKNGVASIGASLVNGESAFDSFKKFLFNTLGDMAIQVGFLISGMGAAIEKMSVALTNWFTAPAAIGAGIALMALGGALKALAGGSGATATSSGAATPAAESVDAATTPEDIDQVQQAAGITVNVDGTVLDPVSVGEQIASVLTEAGFSNGAVTA